MSKSKLLTGAFMPKFTVLEVFLIQTSYLVLAFFSLKDVSSGKQVS